MNKLSLLLLPLAILFGTLNLKAQNRFPDGTKIPQWFEENHPSSPQKLGKKYVITQHGVTNDSTKLQTQAIQAVIDKAQQNGGGLIVIPKGTFLSGSLFFQQGTHLYLEENAVLKGSDDISHFPLLNTRIEGESCQYFAALVNANGLDGFTITGKGTIDGNGLRYWKAFWLRRQFNPQCTNKDEMRPRLVYISNCRNVELSNVRLINSPFWTTHLYKSHYVKLLNLHIYSPQAPVKAPSTDAVDIDVCSHVHIKNCFMSVNDDAVALKGGKGPNADKKPENGANRNIIIEDCRYDFCHGALTCGSESVHNYNIVLRNCTITNAKRLLWLKMRPDTPQNYEYITVENIKGDVSSFLCVKPWTQFFNLKGEKEAPISYSSHITMRNIDMKCHSVFNMVKSEQYQLTNFTFENLNIEASKDTQIPSGLIKNLESKRVSISVAE